MDNHTTGSDSSCCGRQSANKSDQAFSHDKECSIKTNTWSLGKGSQQLLWSLSSKSNVSTMQRNSSTLHKRLSSSHNSLSDSTTKKVDDSIFITQAMSHDALDDNKILDFYNVPLDSDIYSAPIDYITNQYTIDSVLHKTKSCKTVPFQKNEFNLKRRQGPALQETNNRKQVINKKAQAYAADHERDQKRRTISSKVSECNSKKNHFSFNLKQKLCNIFRISKHQQYLRSKKSFLDGHTKPNVCGTKSKSIDDYYKKSSVSTRKLPPLPMSAEKTTVPNGGTVSLEGAKESSETHKQDEASHIMDFTASIDKVKDCGWYWGPISSEGAEKILSNEPDGSFLVRDSSDDHYIFSLTFKLNGSVRHVRIDQDQASATLEKNLTQVLTEDDGCRITSDLVLSVFKNKLLMVLEPDEMWVPVENLNSTSDGTGMQCDGTVSDESKSIQKHNPPDDQPPTIDVNPSMFLHQTQPTSSIISLLPLSSDASSSQPGTSQGVVSILHIESRGDSITAMDVNDSSQQTAAGSSVDSVPVDEVAADANVELLIEEAENCSPNRPNITDKRTRDDVKVLKSCKKFASSEQKFEDFKINWSKISDTILTRLQDLQKFRNQNPGKCAPRLLQLSKVDWGGITHSVVDQLRAIDTEIRANVMEKVAKEILDKYPCLNFLDDDGFDTHTGYKWLKQKLLFRNSYLNRFMAENDHPKPTKIDARRNRNVRAGTNKEYWKASSKECSKDVLSTLARNEPVLLTPEFLQTSQPYVRYRFDEDKSLKDILADLPVLRRKCLLEHHFESATGVSAKSFEKYFMAKRSKIIDYSKTGRKSNCLDTTATDVEILKFLSSLLGEKLEDVIIMKEIGTKIDAISTDCSGPVLVGVGAFSFGSCAKFKSRTIMEFIENAVEHSRSGRYLFFLHRRPEHGPLRVQLTKPVSRFKHVQSLQHLCRFVIHKTIIRKDLIQTLPLPRRLLDYLNYKNCLSERVEVDMTSHFGQCVGDF